MARNVQSTIKQLNRLLRAYDRHLRAVRGPKTSESELDREFEAFAAAIEEEWAGTLDQFMNQARLVLGNLRGADSANDQEVHFRLQQEAEVLKPLNVSRDRINWYFQLYLENQEHSDHFPATSRELVNRLRSIHAAAKSEVASSRSLGRKSKKKRKRKIGKGVASLVFGAGAFVTNSQVAALVPWSYELGGAALLQATRDFVGDSEE